MPALYPSQVAAESFKVGECVRKFITEWNVTPFIGVVSHVVPATCKVWVQWPIGSSPEDPETLIKVNPIISGMPTALVDRGYGSYEKSLSVNNNGQGLPMRMNPAKAGIVMHPIVPRVMTATDKMAIRIAHTYATQVIGKLVDDISSCVSNGFTDVQTYNRMFEKYGKNCSDHIIKSSIEKIYSAK
jgi:hypothetical protein